MSSAQAALELMDVAVGYGEEAVVSGIDLRLDAGEIVVVTGENATGKTTLLRGLFNDVAWLRGTVRWGGQCVQHLRDRRIPPEYASWTQQHRPV